MQGAHARCGGKPGGNLPGRSLAGSRRRKDDLGALQPRVCKRTVQLTLRGARLPTCLLKQDGQVGNLPHTIPGGPPEKRGPNSRNTLRSDRLLPVLFWLQSRRRALKTELAAAVS